MIQNKSNCHFICEENLQKNHCQCHFVAPSILDKRWKCQPDSSNGTPVHADRTKAVVRTSTQLAGNRLRTVQIATLMSNECWNVLEVSLRCKESAQEVPASNTKDKTLKKIKMFIITIKCVSSFLHFLFVSKSGRDSRNSLCAIGPYGRAVWAIGLKFSAFVKNRLGNKMTLTAIFLQFFFAYMVTIKVWGLFLVDERASIDPHSSGCGSALMLTP